MSQRKKARYTVTLLQKYSGKGMANNRVYIDYDKRTVRFDPSPDKRTVLRLFIEDVWFTTMTGGILSAMVAGVGLFVMNGGMINQVLYAELVWSGVVLVFAAHIGKWCSKTWRSNKFPIWNKVNLRLWMRSPKKYRVNTNAIINNTFAIRQFSNVELSYNVTGDFATQLESITIEELYEEHPHEWYAVFTFKNKPTIGTMEVVTI